MQDTTVRTATAADLDAVAAIYDEQVDTGVATFDTEPRGPAHFADRLGGDPLGELLLVAEVDGVVVGYAAAGAFRPRPAYAATRETSVYVAPGAQGRGVARALCTELLRRLDDAGVRTQVAVVALPNPASEALHRRLGFVHVGTLREVGRKHGRWVDTALYQRLADPGSAPSGA